MTDQSAYLRMLIAGYDLHQLVTDYNKVFNDLFLESMRPFMEKSQEERVRLKAIADALKGRWVKPVIGWLKRPNYKILALDDLLSLLYEEWVFGPFVLEGEYYAVV